MDQTILLRKFDDVPPTHVMRETYMTKGEAWQAQGYIFVTPELAARLGEPDSSVTMGEHTYPAWRLPAARLADSIGREERSPVPWSEVKARIAKLFGLN
jgi:hypothetical protein